MDGIKNSNLPNTGGSGYEELAHTADWALRVWAPDLEALFQISAVGMYELSGLKFEVDGGIPVVFSIDAPDSEGLLVAFLSELLFFIEMENKVVENLSLKREGNSLKVHGIGKGILDRKKEIKAVTYHNLNIQQTEFGFETVVVFDV